MLTQETRTSFSMCLRSLLFVLGLVLSGALQGCKAEEPAAPKAAMAKPVEPAAAPSIAPPLQPAAETGAPAAQVPDPASTLKALVAEMTQAGRTGLDKLTEVIRRVDPTFDPAVERGNTLWDGSRQIQAPFAAAEIFTGQMDSDPDLEAAIVVRHHAAEAQNYERSEAFWVGVFDLSAGVPRFVGAIHEAVLHCTWDNARLGLVAGFTEKQPGPTAALWIRTQVSESCGTFVSYKYKKREYRVGPAGLEARDVKPPDGATLDRGGNPAP